MLCSFSHHRQIAGIIQDSVQVFPEMNSYGIYSIQLYIYISIFKLCLWILYMQYMCGLSFDAETSINIEYQANCFHPESNVIGNILQIPELNYLTQRECRRCHAKIFEPQTLKFKG